MVVTIDEFVVGNGEAILLGGREQIVHRHPPARLERKSQFVRGVTHVFRQVIADSHHSQLHKSDFQSLAERRLPRLSWDSPKGCHLSSLHFPSIGDRSSIISISLIVDDDCLKARESWNSSVVETGSLSVEEADEIHRLGHPS